MFPASVLTLQHAQAGQTDALHLVSVHDIPPIVQTQLFSQHAQRTSIWRLLIRSPRHQSLTVGYATRAVLVAAVATGLGTSPDRVERLATLSASCIQGQNLVQRQLLGTHSSTRPLEEVRTLSIGQQVEDTKCKSVSAVLSVTTHILEGFRGGGRSCRGMLT